jgi:hypothetical protein
MVSRSADAELNALVIEKFGASRPWHPGAAPAAAAGCRRINHFDKGGACKRADLHEAALDAGMSSP